MRSAQDQTPPPFATWLNLICLDAPLVAVSWQELFARSRAVAVPAPARAALFATAWLIYLADRLGDANTVPAGSVMSQRQRFARSHPAVFALAITVGAIVDAIAIPRLDSQTLAAGAIIGCVSAMYLVTNHLLSRIWRIVPAKEIVIGFLFAAGVRASFGNERGGRFGSGAAFFALLCAFNCVSIAFWEHAIDAAQNRGSIATAFPRWRPVPLIASTVLAFVACAGAFSSQSWLPLVCVAASASLLAALNVPATRIDTDSRTAIADLVMLTPLVALPFAR